MMDKETKLLIALMYTAIYVIVIVAFGIIIFELQWGYPERFMELFFQTILFCIAGYFVLIALFVIDEYKPGGK